MRSEDCRRQAQRCREKAIKVKPEIARELFEVAAAWDTVAEQAERLERVLGNAAAT